MCESTRSFTVFLHRGGLLGILLVFLAGCSDPVGPGEGPGEGSQNGTPGLPEIHNRPMPELEGWDSAALGPNRIAFHRMFIEGQTPSGLYVLDGRDASAAAYLGGTLMGNPTVSPAGTEVAFSTLTPYDPARMNQSAWDLYVVDLDGEGLSRITGFSGNVEGPAGWSAAGDAILFAVTLPGETELYRQPLPHSFGSRRRITSLLDQGSLVVWEPQMGPLAESGSGRIAFPNSWGEGSKGIHVLEPGEDIPTRVYEAPADDGTIVRSPAWSPGGDRVVFLEVDPLVETRVKILDVGDGSVSDNGAVSWSEPSGIPNIPGSDLFSTCWTRDGSRIVFSTPDGASDSHLYVVPPGGTDPLPLTTAGGVVDGRVSCLE